MKIFFLPYAGGSASVFYQWKKFIEAKGLPIECIPIELAGRGRKFKEDLYQNFEDALKKLTVEIRNHIENDDGKPFSIFGHSLGGFLAFKIAKELETAGSTGPEWLFLSGVNPPHLLNTNAESSLSDTEFLEHVKKLGGTSPSFFKSKELVELYTPILKSDFHLLETYSLEMGEVRTNSNIMAFSGEQDNLSNNAELWKKYTRGKFTLTNFPGDHFFLNSSYKEMLQAMSKEIYCNEYPIRN
ncbi:hypothetical protein A6P54_13565 [Bacillus sp. MKU004]|nr:hypothetical protein A6P54_13565 [Bacillus sp. MKU004]